MNCRLFYRLFFVLCLLQLLLFVCFLLQGIICVAQEEHTTDNVELFKFEKNKKPLKPNGTEGETNIEVKNVGNIFFVATDEFMIALAKAEITKSPGGSKAADHLVAEYIKNKEDKWEEDVLDSASWTEQLVTDDDTLPKIFPDKDGFAAVTKNQSIYIFAFKSTTAKELLGDRKNLEAALVVGKVEDGRQQDNKKITWNKEETFKVSSDSDFADKITEVQKNKILSKTLNEGSAFLAREDKTIVFLLRNEAEKSEENVTVFFQLEENVDSKELKLLNVEIAEKCYPYFFPWENKIMMVPTNCGPYISQKVKESTDMKTWNNSSGSLSRLRNAFLDKGGFTTAKINESTILFTYNISASEESDTHLWISDGTRMASVGTIVTKSEGSFCGSVLCTNGELFSLYKQCKLRNQADAENHKVTLKHLEELMNNTKFVLESWKNSDSAVSALCQKEVAHGKLHCNTAFSSDRLVGFLSGKSDNNQKIWEDEYFYVNATVEKGTKGAKVENGFTFSGPGAGALWQVSKNFQPYVYNFAEYGFTLLATVTIEKASKDNEHNSVMGVRINYSSSKNCFALWCTKTGHWGVAAVEGLAAIKETKEKCGEGTTHIIVLTVHKKKIVAYVDGKELVFSQGDSIIVQEEDTIQYFYFGVDNQSESKLNIQSHITVTNALLYNRPFNSDEIKTLKPKKNEATDAQQSTENDTSKQQNLDKSTTQTDKTASTSPTQNDVQSSPPTTEDSAVRVDVVGVLCFMLFGVFTLLGRYVY